MFRIATLLIAGSGQGRLASPRRLFTYGYRTGANPVRSVLWRPIEDRECNGSWLIAQSAPPWRRRALSGTGSGRPGALGGLNSWGIHRAQRFHCSLSCATEQREQLPETATGAAARRLLGCSPTRRPSGRTRGLGEWTWRLRFHADPANISGTPATAGASLSSRGAGLQ